MIKLFPKPIGKINFLDAGAGTGIWTRMVCERKPISVTAVEPNKDMLERGIRDSKAFNIKWIQSQAEDIEVASNSMDWVTMASSFHWVDFERASLEFSRILREGGIFSALWNTRKTTQSPLLTEIEEYLRHLAPNLQRVSSGGSTVNEQLAEKLNELAWFQDLKYIEAEHSVFMEPERYLGVWKSVNDIQAQLGAKKFAEFFNFIENILKDQKSIEAVYITRSWSVKLVS